MTITDLRALRRRLHQTAELGLHLPRTQQVILDELEGLGLEIQTGQGSSSITAILRGRAGAAEPRAVLLRADMDALPLTESTGIAWAAPGNTMHACGHDLHMAMLVGAARLLAARVDELEGDVVFAFQPGEENHGGAQLMLAEGLLDSAGVPIIAALGLHVFSANIPRGVLSFRSGPIMAASTVFDVTFIGQGGHGSSPQDTKDPVPAAAAFVTSLYAATTRAFGMHDRVVVTIGHVSAGDSGNVIPEKAVARGTARTLEPGVQAAARDLIERVANGVAQTFGVDVEIDMVDAGIPVQNDPEETEFAMRIAEDELGPDAVSVLPQPSAASEDFSWILARVPGLFAFLGTAPEDVDPAHAEPNHSPAAEFDDSVLETGAQFEAAWALRRLRRAGGAERNTQREGERDEPTK